MFTNVNYFTNVTRIAIIVITASALILAIVSWLNLMFILVILVWH